MPDKPSQPRDSDRSSDPSGPSSQKKAGRKKSSSRRRRSRRRGPAEESAGSTAQKPAAKPTQKAAKKKAKAPAKAAGGRSTKSKASSQGTQKTEESLAPRETNPPRRPGPVDAGGGLLIGGRSRSSKAKPKRKPRATPAPPTGPREKFRGLTLNDFQMRALGPLREGRPVLLAAPTGAGKTLVAELAIDMSLKAGKRAIYTAPIKALSNQKYRDFKAIDPDMVGLMTGDVTINPGASVLIMTTEIFRNTILESPESLSDVDTVVFDEIHYMDDPERGTVWEESIIFAPQHIRFVCLSATISNLTQYGDWISSVRGKTVEVIRHTERPVPLDHYLFFPSGGLRHITGPVKFPAAHVKAFARRGRPPRVSDRNAIVERLVKDENLPALFFCFSRRDCERRALETSSKLDLLDPDEARTIEALFEEVCQTFMIEPNAEVEELRSLVRRGIAFHHAGMLPLHKELVERLFTSGLLRLLFATETFSLGINMPARAVVFASLRKYDGKGFGPLKVREYQQMAGRAGRQGIDDQGVVVSIVDDHRVQPGDIEHMLSNDVEPILSRFNLSYSSLINLHRTLGGRLHEAWERSFNNFQWSSMSKRKRDKNSDKQRAAIDRRLALLTERGYITADGVTPKGQLAASINGYELQVVELYESGLLEWMSEIQIAITFAAICFEERKNDLFKRMKPGVMGSAKKDVENVVGQLISHEKALLVPPTIKAPNFKIGVVVYDWCQGASFDEMRDHTNSPNGDLVRVMRLTVQLLRQLRSSLPAGSPLLRPIDRARDLLNRSEVDAARQLSLG